MTSLRSRSLSLSLAPFSIAKQNPMVPVVSTPGPKAGGISSRHTPDTYQHNVVLVFMCVG
jgi:hypothetical protein